MIEGECDGMKDVCELVMGKKKAASDLTFETGRRKDGGSPSRFGALLDTLVDRCRCNR